MPTTISRLYNYVDDKTNGIPITASREDGELNQLVLAANHTCITSASAPSSPNAGDIWVDTTNKFVKFYRNGEWVSLGIVQYGTVMATPQSGDCWIDNSGSEAILKFRNKANNAWIKALDGNITQTDIPELTSSGNKVDGSALIGLANTPSGSGIFPVANIGALLGAWTSKTVGTIYQAATDGIVLAFSNISGTTSNILSLISDSSATPSTVRSSSRVNFPSSGSGTVALNVISPVKKNDYYQVTLTSDGSPSNTMFFIPLGS